MQEKIIFSECSFLASTRRASSRSITRRPFTYLRAGEAVAVFLSVHERGVEGRLLGKALVAGLCAGDTVDRHVVLQARHGQVCDPKTARPARVHLRVKGEHQSPGTHFGVRSSRLITVIGAHFSVRSSYLLIVISALWREIFVPDHGD